MSTNASQPPSTRGLVMTAAIIVAVISTGGAYLAMVAFGIDVLEMTPGTAYSTAGVFEMALITVALLAREAAKQNRPATTLLALTWLLSSASGAFAAWHELFIDHPLGAAIFRFLVPLLAALMWHLALIGDRHLATGTTWTEARIHVRMHAFFTLTEDWVRAQVDAQESGSRRARAIAQRAERRRRRAKKRAQRTVPPAQMRKHVAAWVDAGGALTDGGQQVAVSIRDELERAHGAIADIEAVRTERAIETHVHDELRTHAHGSEVPAHAEQIERAHEPRALDARAPQPADVRTSVHDHDAHTASEVEAGTGAHAERAHTPHSPSVRGTAGASTDVPHPVRTERAHGPEQVTNGAHGAVRTPDQSVHAPAREVGADVRVHGDASAQSVRTGEPAAHAAHTRGAHTPAESMHADRAHTAGRKLTEEDWPTVRDMRTAGEGWVAIGRVLGVHRTSAKRFYERMTGEPAPATPAHGTHTVEPAAPAAEPMMEIPDPTALVAAAPSTRTTNE